MHFSNENLDKVFQGRRRLQEIPVTRSLSSLLIGRRLGYRLLAAEWLHQLPQSPVEGDVKHVIPYPLVNRTIKYHQHIEECPILRSVAYSSIHYSRTFELQVHPPKIFKKSPLLITQLKASKTYYKG